ncbi:GL14625 [Drosophila persimilis]|uniref:GL14625 n=1 Tax=Drosophila persimilis TaxID=7234 RepID=B4GVQ3_DROPE|nr:GL14625 [Drosophila persimilis]
MDRLCIIELYSDVSFLVRVNTFVLCSTEKKRQIRLGVDAPLEALKVILGYLYSGKMPISSLDVDAICEVFAWWMPSRP